MRIAIVNWNRRSVGGAEKYLGGIIPELHRGGHELAFLHELDTPAERERIALPDSVPAWSVPEMGHQPAVAALRAWAPDLIYMHSSVEQDWIAPTVAQIPTAFFCHDYVGTCISGGKSFKLPVIRPCDRRFGPACLLHYYPHHCGGWSPVSMIDEYRKQLRRLHLLRTCRGLLTASESMWREYVRHGFAPESVHHVPYPVVSSDSAPAPAPPEPLRLLFAGRMERVKGGRIFLDALPRVAETLGRPFHVTFAGDGACLAEWRKRAAGLKIPIEFTGWLTPERVNALLRQSHLLVVPSVWPEPFGLIGVEAGLQGVPAAAFAVGGIPDWLHDGVNGYLAPGDPPRASALADVIVRCLRDSETYAALREGAYEIAKRFTMARHMETLTDVLERVAQ